MFKIIDMHVPSQQFVKLILLIIILIKITVIISNCTNTKPK